MKKIFERHEALFCILLIVVYLIEFLFCLQNFGVQDYRSALINSLFTISLIAIIIEFKRVSYYGLTKVTNAKAYLYFIPLILIGSVNLWNGIHINHPVSEIIFYLITMMNIGIIEEIVFRGFLFKMLAKKNVKRAIIVSALTFGMEHLFLLFTGADIFLTLLQICYAVSLGFLFVTIFYKSKSLIPCMITHAMINSLSIFSYENWISLYVAPVFLIIVPFVYTMYINKTIKA